MNIFYRWSCLIFIILTACDLRIQRVREYRPEGPSVNYRINDCVGAKDKYLTGSRWTGAGDPSCVLSAWDERDRTRWDALYSAGHIRSSEGRAVGIFPARMESRTRIFVLIQAVDTAGQNRVILAEYDTLGVRRFERTVMTSAEPLSAELMIDYGQEQVYVTGSVEEAGAVKILFIFRYRPESRGTWTRKFEDPSLHLTDVRWVRAADQGFIAAGVLEDKEDVAYVRFDSIGGFKKVVRNETPGREDGLAGIDIDIEGNVGLAAVTYDAGTGAGYLTAVFDNSDRLVWTSRHDGPGDDLPVALVMTGDGGAYVTGCDASDGGGTMINTILYDRQGREKWSRTIRGRDGEDARPCAMDYQFPQPGYVGKETASDLCLAGTSGNDALVAVYNGSGILQSLRFSHRGQACVPAAVNRRYMTVNYSTADRSGACVVHFGPFEIPGIKRWD